MNVDEVFIKTNDYRACNLIFIDGPELLSQLNGTRSVPEMSNITFDCKAEGHPTPTIQWYKSGKILQYVPMTKTTLSSTKALVESSLVLKRVTKNDTAEYKCEVTNIAGRKEQISTLSVLCKFVFKIALHRVY